MTFNIIWRVYKKWKGREQNGFGLIDPKVQVFAEDTTRIIKEFKPLPIGFYKVLILSRLYWICLEACLSCAVTAIYRGFKGAVKLRWDTEMVSSVD